MEEESEGEKFNERGRDGRANEEDIDKWYMVLVLKLNK